MHLSAGGKIEQTFEAITATEQQTLLAARAALAAGAGADASVIAPSDALGATPDAPAAACGCSIQTNITGNQICLFLPADLDWFDLGTVCRIRGCATGTWANAVHSLWAGTYPGSLLSCTPRLCSATAFLNVTPFQRINSGAWA